MASLPEIVVIQASDAPQHTAHLRKILQKLKNENRIKGFMALSPGEDLSSSVSDTLKKDDMILIVLTSELEGNRGQIKKKVSSLKSDQPGLRVAEILVDNLIYDNDFITFPTDLKPIRDRNDMDEAWVRIGSSLRDMFPVRDPKSDPEKEKKPAKKQKQFGNWSNSLKIFGIIIGLVLLGIVIVWIVDMSSTQPDPRPIDPVPVEPLPDYQP